MEKINGFKIDKFNFTLNKRGDLIYFDSPLLSHFYDEDGKDYLMQWVDCNEKFNRWVLYRVETIDLFLFFKSVKSLKNLLVKSSEIVFVIDIDSDINFKHIHVASNKNLPKEYLPNDKSYYNENYYTNYAKNLSIEIISIVDKYKLKGFKSKINYKLNFIDNVDSLTTNINYDNYNSLDDIVSLKATEIPLIILNDYFKSEFKSFNHLINKSKNAYTSPIERDSFFFELNSILVQKMQISNSNIFPKKGRLNTDQLIEKLFQVTLEIVNKNPVKYKDIYIKLLENIDEADHRLENFKKEKLQL
ncbi:MAG: hypothetical protein RLZZ175_3338 [Bacteroidota bacterium]|jgi:hypothetical protein